MHWMFIASSMGGSTIFVPHLFKLVRLKKGLKFKLLAIWPELDLWIVFVPLEPFGAFLIQLSDQ